MSAEGVDSEFADGDLWADLNEHVHAVMGDVGVVKMLKVRDEEEGERLWAGRVRPVLQRVHALVPLERTAAACYSSPDSVSVQFGIHDAAVSVDGAPAVRTLLLPDPAVIVLGVIGARRWPDRWAQVLGSAQPDVEVVLRDSAASDVAEYPWFVRNSGDALPWTVAASEDSARVAGAAQKLGFDRVAALFAELEDEAR